VSAKPIIEELPAAPLLAQRVARQRTTNVRHHFTIDVEEYFQVSALEPYVARDRWQTLESRVVQGMERLLELLSEHEVQATCFVLGWIAERHPQLIRNLSDCGHEVASHGWDHRRVTQQTSAEFRTSVRRSKDALEDIVGRRVLGFRAPSFSIVEGREWALDILAEEGYRYDSSLFPIRRPGGYGYASAHYDAHWLERPSGLLAEFPPATLGVLGMRVPAAGGAYFRLLPYRLVHAAFDSSTQRGTAATFYIHPWELDPDQPRFPVPLPVRVRHYGGLRRTAPRLRRILSQFCFQTIESTLMDLHPLHLGAMPSLQASPVNSDLDGRSTPPRS
jgi:polysaccharide deacetylase family protein (PEP-CTERM system associated)